MVSCSYICLLGIFLLLPQSLLSVGTCRCYLLHISLSGGLNKKNEYALLSAGNTRECFALFVS